jgi:hypothetical protein
MTSLHGGGPDDELLQRVLSGDEETAANELLEAFFRGYPVERLNLLLRSDNGSAVRAGAWIASELGAKAAALLPQIASVLEHESRYVRFFAIDAVLAIATEADGSAVASAIERIHDDDQAVRWKALQLLAKASNEQLVSAVPFLSEGNLARGVEFLATASPGRDEVIRRLAADDDLTRLVAVAAAARLAPEDETALQHARDSADPDVGRFAAEELESHRSD